MHRVQIPHEIPCPVLEPDVENFQLEWNQAVKDIVTRGQWFNRGQDGVEVGAFCCALVEEPETGEAGESKKPELFQGRKIIRVVKGTTR